MVWQTTFGPQAQQLSQERGAGAEIEGEDAGQEGLGIPGGKATADRVWAPGPPAEPEAHGGHAAVLRLHVRAAAQEGLPGWPGMQHFHQDSLVADQAI